MDMLLLLNNRGRAHHSSGMDHSCRPGVVLVGIYMLLAQDWVYINVRRSQAFLTCFNLQVPDFSCLLIT